MAGIRVYIARMAGTAIFDPNGEQVGRVSDAVVRASLDRDPPKVLGLVAEIQAFRRIFVPMGRVSTIDAAAIVLTTGTLNLRKFALRPGESLVLGELLDRPVTVGGERVLVSDVAMEPTAPGEWHLSTVALRPRGGRLTRRGPLRQIAWSDIDALAATADTQGAANLVSATEGLRPADLASMVQDLPMRRRVELAAALDDERLADLLEELPEHDQVDIVNSLGPRRAGDVIGEMDPDDAADLLNTMPATQKYELLSLMEPDEAHPIRQLLNYRKGTAGGMMTSEPLILPPDASIAEALALLREPQHPPTIAAQVFVCRPPTVTPTGRYLGMAHFQRLLREPPSMLLASCVTTDIDPIDPDLPLLDLTRRLATYDLVAMPVVRDDRLYGAVTVDDVLDHLLPSDWRERERG
ncbi:magnesium transporter MgtE N-terminal domain-containing protein [Stackebrandtia soli]|uniref:magnesium transporter MgtE N-terminal domain-containing protein n=1 Tax=Stackebrandtia soli TaxID=1892856 RepID=UPI0039EA7B0A